ncbi:unnamed protein product [Lactuca virosa]|uniref:Uncharacterized protein n=1 Tax=Lactuca virosa TaxID=75947 RepID=A0AAU9NWG6_9ASTR|nr:unnamed protein product [Lactuca virosa]
MSQAPSRKFWPSQVEDSQNRAGSGSTNNNPPSCSAVRKLVRSSAEDGQYRGDPIIQMTNHYRFKMWLQDLCTEHLKVHYGSMTKRPPSAGALTHGN